VTIWHWVRHAPTHQKTFVGWRDVTADVSDHDQFARLNAFLPQDALLLSSDLCRARQTAERLAAPRRTALPAAPGLREIHFGVWDGMHFSDVAERDPGLSRQFWEEPGDICAPGGESWNMASERVAAVVTHLSARFPSAQIIAVAHFGAILTQVQRASGQTAYDTLAHRIDNLSVTDMRFDGAHWHIGRINHLP